MVAIFIFLPLYGAKARGWYRASRVESVTQSQRELVGVPVRGLTCFHSREPGSAPSRAKAYDIREFAVTDDSLVEWQKWRFRVSFNPREGAVLHDIHYDGRSVLYRLSISEMTVPYGDPRPPFHRKQAFDFGDGGAGNCANNQSLGCDCLGVIKYFDGVVVDSTGEPKVHPNVVCLHEQDNGIGWKVCYVFALFKSHY